MVAFFLLILIFIIKITNYNTYYNMKKVIRLTEADLHRIVKESVNRILNEEYKGVYIDGLGLPKNVVMSKIDACIEKGWPIEKIQRAVDAWAYENNNDYDYRY